MGARKALRRAAASGLLVAACIGPLAASAQAQQRGGIFGDAADATPTISGQPSNPDISQVAVAYDPAGQLALTINFYNALNGLDTSSRYDFYGFFAVGQPVLADDPAAGCQRDLDGQNNIVRAGAGGALNQASVRGFDGKLPFTRTVSADQRQLTLTASSPAIANRDWRCSTYVMYSKTRSTASNINSRYDENCDCWYVIEKLDGVGEEQSFGLDPVMWFAGLRPVKPAPPRPIVAGKLKVKPKASLKGRKLKVTLNSGPEVIGRTATVTLQARSGKSRRYKKLGKSKTWKVKKVSQSRTFIVSRRRKAIRVTVKVKGFTNPAAFRKYPTRTAVLLARRK